MFTKAFEFKTDEVSAEGEFVGYASTNTNTPDSYGDVILAGAFAKSLAAHKANNSMPMMFFGHNATELPIGDWLEMSEDSVGLVAKGRIALDDPLGARVHSAVKAGRVKGLSIGYRIPKGGMMEDPDRDGVYLLKEIDLVEVSIVNIPANSEAQVASVKAAKAAHELTERLKAGDQLTEREFKKWLKGLSFSNSQAERAVRIHLNGQGDPAKTAPSASDLLKALCP